MPTVITMSYFFCVDGEEEKTVSVLLNGEESTMSFIDPDSDNVSTKSSFYLSIFTLFTARVSLCMCVYM